MDIIVLIETWIEAMGFKPAESRSTREGAWHFMQGSARVDIVLGKVEESGELYLCAASALAPVPKEKEKEFYLELLKLNTRFIGMAFCIHNGYAVLKHETEIKGLEQSSFEAIVKGLAQMADYFDNVLQDRFPAVERSLGVPSHIETIIPGI